MVIKEVITCTWHNDRVLLKIHMQGRTCICHVVTYFFSWQTRKRIFVLISFLLSEMSYLHLNMKLWEQRKKSQIFFWRNRREIPNFKDKDSFNISVINNVMQRNTPYMALPSRINSVGVLQFSSWGNDPGYHCVILANPKLTLR